MINFLIILLGVLALLYPIIMHDYGLLAMALLAFFVGVIIGLMR